MNVKVLFFTIIIMVRRCVAANCSNSNETEGVAVHLFPSDNSISRKWIKFVQVKRVWKPNSRAKTRPLLCSKHFTPDCYKNFTKVSLGFATKLHLKDNAVPTIHAPEQNQASTSRGASSAVRKREVSRVG